MFLRSSKLILLSLALLIPSSVEASRLTPTQAKLQAQRVAQRAAVSAERLARNAAKEAKDFVDVDKDGVVSTDELEGAAEKLRAWCIGVAGRVRRFYTKYRDACLAVGGLTGLLHGGTVAYTILCSRAFAATGWPLVRQSVAKMGDAYTAAKREMAGAQPVSPAEYAAMQTEMQALAHEMEELVESGASEKRQEAVLAKMRALRAKLDAASVKRAWPVLLRALEPTLVRDVVLGLWSGLTLSVAAASSSAARSLGIGVSIGEVGAAVG